MTRFYFTLEKEIFFWETIIIEIVFYSYFQKLAFLKKHDV